MMKKRMIFMVSMLAACVWLFLQRFTGMGVHAILGLAVLIAGISHTVKFRKVWKNRRGVKKAVEIGLWAALIAVTVSGFLLKPFGEVITVLMVHKLGAVVFTGCLAAHIWLCMPTRKRCDSK
ncbi:MAG: hypothetical protein IJZ85_02080 [Lachnospiraceae bacterium]|nr:hypothetical protein [Lachnospiraceae bacterium]